MHRITPLHCAPPPNEFKKRWLDRNRNETFEPTVKPENIYDSEEQKEVIDSIIERFEERDNNQYLGNPRYPQDESMFLAANASSETLKYAYQLREIPPSSTLNDPP